MSYSERKYWMPRTRREVVEWFVSRGELTKSDAGKMTTKQLYGKYIQRREELK